MTRTRTIELFDREDPWANSEKTDRLVIIGGLFSPFEIKDLDRIQDLSRFGKLAVVVFNDTQQEKLLNKAVIPIDERMRVVAAMRDVDLVIESTDQDLSINQSLQSIATTHDQYWEVVLGIDQESARNGLDFLEYETCRDLGIKVALATGIDTSEID